MAEEHPAAPRIAAAQLISFIDAAYRAVVEYRHRRIIERQARGFPIPPALRGALDNLAAELAITPLFG